MPSGLVACDPPRKIKVVCTREEGFPIEVKLLEA